MKLAKKIILGASLCFLAFTANATKDKNIEIDEDQARAAVSSATKARKAAKAVGGEWRDVYKYIKKGRKELRKGNYKKSFEYSQLAERQAKYGYQQAVSQKKVSADFYYPSR